jgi:hypothetical protein
LKIKEKTKLIEMFRALRSLIPLENSYIPSLWSKWHVRPQCSLLKAQKAKVKKEVPRQANYGTRPLAQ